MFGKLGSGVGQNPAGCNKPAAIGQAIPTRAAIAYNRPAVPRPCPPGFVRKGPNAPCVKR
jgi:hypothetical protein